MWAGKKLKIPLNILQKRKEDGGLGLVDLQNKHTALICSWVKEVRNNVRLEKMVQYFLGHSVNAHSIWEYNLTPKDAKQFFNDCNFWHNLVGKWAEFHYQCPQSVENIKEEILWMNSNIRQNGAPLKLMAALPPNMKIKDLLNDHNEWLPIHQLQKEFPNSSLNWLQLRSIRDSIPPHWRSMITAPTVVNDNYENKLLIVCNSPHSSKVIYNELIASDKAILKSGKVWEKRLDTFEWDIHYSSFKDIQTVTNITKLRNFQFRLLHNTIYCNNVLFHWHKVPNQQCELCNAQAKQTTLHLLWQYKTVQTIWEKLISYFDKMVPNQLCEYNVTNMIYNKFHPKMGHVINALTLLTKLLFIEVNVRTRNQV